MQSLFCGSPGRAETSGRGSLRLRAIRLTRCQRLLACLLGCRLVGRTKGRCGCARGRRGGADGVRRRDAGGRLEAKPFTIAFTGYQILTHRPVERILNGLSCPSIRPGGLSASARKGSGKEGAGRLCAASVNSARARRRAAFFPHASVHYRPYWLSTQHLIAI